MKIEVKIFNRSSVREIEKARNEVFEGAHLESRKPKLSEGRIEH